MPDNRSTGNEFGEIRITGSLAWTGLLLDGLFYAGKVDLLLGYLSTMLADNFGRPIKSMRIQVNTACNLKCFFCHMEGTPVHMDAMLPQEIEAVVRTASGYGVNKIKFTGGEPLMRRDMAEIVARTRKHISGDISMTTNGFFLPKYARELRNAGLDRVNISMHSIESEGFRFITGTDGLSKVRSAIASAKDAGFHPIKINFVVLKGVNEDQIESMLEFCAENGVTLQLIEFETTREGLESEQYQKYHRDISYLVEEFSVRSDGIRYNDIHLRPRFNVETAKGRTEVELVMPMKNWRFCNNCTRMRLTSEGRLKSCLMRSDLDVDISEFSRKGKELDLSRAFVRAVKMREPYWKIEDEIITPVQVIE